MINFNRRYIIKLIRNREKLSLKYKLKRIKIWDMTLCIAKGKRSLKVMKIYYLHERRGEKDGTAD